MLEVRVVVSMIGVLSYGGVNAPDAVKSLGVPSRFPKSTLFLRRVDSESCGQKEILSIRPEGMFFELILDVAALGN